MQSANRLLKVLIVIAVVAGSLCWTGCGKQSEPQTQRPNNRDAARELTEDE